MKIKQWLLVWAFASSAVAAGPVLDLEYRKEPGGISVVNHGSHNGAVRLGQGEEAELETEKHFKALRFPKGGEQFIEVKNRIAAFESKFTIALWIRPEPKKGWMELVSFGTDSRPSGVRLRWSSWNSLGTVALLSGNGSESRLLKAPENSAPAHSWTHVAAVFDGTDARLFINGEEMALMKANDLDFTQGKSTPLLIGNYGGRKDAYAFAGLIGPVKIFNEPLETSAIQALAKP